MHLILISTAPGVQYPNNNNNNNIVELLTKDPPIREHCIKHLSTMDKSKYPKFDEDNLYTGFILAPKRPMFGGFTVIIMIMMMIIIITIIIIIIIIVYKQHAQECDLGVNCTSVAVIARGEAECNYPSAINPQNRTCQCVLLEINHMPPHRAKISDQVRYYTFCTRIGAEKCNSSLIGRKSAITWKIAFSLLYKVYGDL